MRGMVFVLVALVSQLGFADYPVRPNPSQTPGTLCSERDRDFDGYRYQERIPYCHRDVDGGMKRRIYAQYGIPDYCRGKFTVDHFYPLSMGGNNAAKNLWPEHRNIKALRQNLEQEVFDRLRRGELTQKEALSIIKDAKMNPPVEELRHMWLRGDDCDRAAVSLFSF